MNSSQVLRLSAVVAKVLDGFVSLVYARSMWRSITGLLLAVVVATQLHDPSLAAATSHTPDRLLQSGHTSSIQALAFSSDGRWMA